MISNNDRIILEAAEAILRNAASATTLEAYSASDHYSAARSGRIAGALDLAAGTLRSALIAVDVYGPRPDDDEPDASEAPESLRVAP